MIPAGVDHRDAAGEVVGPSTYWVVGTTGFGLEAAAMIGALMLLTGYVGGHAELTSTLSQAGAWRT